MRARQTWITLGLALIVTAVAGWLITSVALSFEAQPRDVEDLTAAWTAAGEIPLGESATVTVPAGLTLVAFLVGTELRGSAGTTTGDCDATASGRRLPLSWPVYINPSLSGVLHDGQEVVAVAGWHNDGPATAVRISCRARDSDVEHYVAVATRTGALQHRRWFQPWAWALMALAGAALAVIGVGRRRGV